MIKSIDEEKYRIAIADMLTLTGYSNTATTLSVYLTILERHFGEDFNPIEALDGLIKAANNLKTELEK